MNNLFPERQMRLLVDSLYASWREPGEGRPFVAMANKEGKALSDKLLDCARIGVAYYIVYDPRTLIGERPLRVFARQGLRYTEMDALWLDQVGLGLTLWEGEYEGMRQMWLHWCDADGNLLFTGQEAAAEKERQLLAERARAEQERQRAAALAAKLAALGIDSEAE